MGQGERVGALVAQYLINYLITVLATEFSVRQGRAYLTILTSQRISS